MTDALFLIENRKTVNNFTSKEVAPDILSKILNCARLTPTNKYLQEWKFVVIKNNNTKHQLKNITNVDCLETAPVVIAFFSKDNKFSVEYASAATESIIITANHYDLGAHWHIVYNEPYSREIEDLLNAPKDYHLMGLIALGYYSFASPNIQHMPSLSEMTITEKFK